jgi:hypothetical protein
MEMDGLDSRASMGETNGNESAMFCVIPAFESFRRTVSRVYGAFASRICRGFVADLSRVFVLPLQGD